MKKNENTNMKEGNTPRKSLAEIYNEAKALPTPAQCFVIELAKVTHKSPFTVRQWLYGAQLPDSLTQSVIAEHFGVDVGGLFPERNAI
jgi:hypothetical protein